MGDKEAFYVAWGPGKKEAEKSKCSLLEQNDIPVTIFTKDSIKGKRHVRKVTLISEFEPQADYVLYLDTDTTILGSVKPIFDALKYTHADIALVPAPKPMRQDDVPDALQTFNSGVIGFRKSTQWFMHDWASLVEKYPNDQLALRYALSIHKLCVAALLPIYNFRPHIAQRLSTRPVILHGRGWKNHDIAAMVQGLWIPDKRKVA
jgi:hypothetical protein